MILSLFPLYLLRVKGGSQSNLGSCLYCMHVPNHTMVFSHRNKDHWIPCRGSPCDDRLSKV